MPSPTTSSELHDSSSRAYKKARRQHLKTTTYRNSDADLDRTPFRTAEKQYKARFPPPDLSNVLDLATLDEARTEEIQRGVWSGRSDTVEYREITPTEPLGESKKAYIIPRIPGLVLLPTFVSSQRQKQLVRWSLSDQARHPNETNLDVHYVLPENGLWDTCIRARTDASKDILVQPRILQSESSFQTHHELPSPRTLINNTPITPDNFHSLSNTPKPPSYPSPTVQPTLSSALLRKLRWANIGWYYHWGTKQYDFTKGRGNVDNDVRDVCKSAVRMVDWEQVFGLSVAEWGAQSPDWKAWNETYEPDAGIVNFYQTKDTLMAHVDRSEVCATSPLVSISLGNAAIFLIGGVTRDVEPVSILLRSGDVVIMSGPACRRAYHGVPRVLEGTLPPHFDGHLDDEIAWKPYQEYMRTTRINVNVRQVFPIGFDHVDKYTV